MHRVAQIVELPQDGLRARVEDATGRGRRHARDGPFEQLHLQLVLEDRELLAQRGLRHAAERGGAGDAPAVDDLDEVSQSAAIHARDHKSRL